MQNEVVSHPKYGSGIVKQTRLNEFEFYVEFNDGQCRWVKFNEITRPEQIAAANIPVNLSALLQPDTSFPSRRMIEAFRLGIVPYDHVEDFTFGRENEVQNLKKWLKSKVDNTLFVVGNYGTGKSHLLTYIKEYALRERYAVAFAELDDNEATFSKPKSIYRQLIKSFCYFPKGESKKHGFRDFVSTALKKGALTDHKYFSVLKNSDNEELWDWIKGNTYDPGYYYFSNCYISTPSLYNYATAANIYCNLLSGLGWAAIQALGLKGLILVFDESENIFGDRRQYYLNKANNFILAMIRTANNEAALCQSPVNARPYLDFSRHSKHTPFLYKEQSGLKLVFGFTPIDYTRHLKNILDGIQQIDLSHFSDKALKQAYDEIHSLYEKSYPQYPAASSLDQVLERDKLDDFNMRHFVKASVEALDIDRFNNKIQVLENKSK